MRLIQVTKDTTMLVSGYEHHTWQCSGCSTVEQRMTFTREKTVSGEPAQIIVAEPTETAAQLTQAVPVEPMQTLPVEAAQTMSAERTKIAPVEPTQPVPPQPTHREAPAAMVKINTRAKALDEKLRALKERVNAARETAGEPMRSTQFNRHTSRSVSAPLAASESPSHSDEPLQSQTELIVYPAPRSDDEPITTGNNASVATKLRERMSQLARHGWPFRAASTARGIWRDEDRGHGEQSSART